MITFTPLSGSAHSQSTSPLAYLFQVDDVRILLDCGSPDWRTEPSFSTENYEKYCQSIKQIAPTIDLVLLSHGDLAHAGLFPYAFCRWGLKAPCYSTIPVQATARIAVTEDVEGLRDEQEMDDSDMGEDVNNLSASEPDADQPTNDADEPMQDEGDTKPPPKGPKRKFVATIHEVNEAFDSVNTLRYSQPTHLQGKCQGLTITPFSAGHTLGGAVWKIRSPSAGTIVYAVNLNHMKERHLDGTILLRPGGGSGVFEPLLRPDLLITDAERASSTSSRRKDRDAALLDCVTATLSSRHSLLLPCDSSTRVLELLVLLDQHWNYSRLKYPICLLSRTGEEMLTFVRSMMEWLGGTVNKEDVGMDGSKPPGKSGKRKRDDQDDEAIGAFALRFRHLEFYTNPAALLAKHSSKDAKLILAVPASLSHGPSRALFADFASIPGNVVLLTQRGPEGTLGRILFDKWNDSQRADDKWDKGRIGSNVMLDGNMVLQMYAKVPLQGAELEEFLQRERQEKEKEAAHKAVQERKERMLEADEADDDDSDIDDDSEEENEVEMQLAGGMDVDEDEKPDARLTRKKKPSGAGGAGGLGASDEWDPTGEDGALSKHLSFDIYLKGNVSKSTSFFKSADGQTSQRFRMFPYIEKKRRVDEYGETIDVALWLRRDKVFQYEGRDEEKEKKRVLDEDGRNAPREPPSKFVSSTVEVQLACRLLFVDLEGLNDGRAVKTIVPQIHPRKMIIVHAPPEAANALIQSCGDIRAMTRDIYAPVQDETIQIGQQTNTFAISLSDEVLTSIKMSRFEDNEVGFITGRVTNLATSVVPVLEPWAPSPQTAPSVKATPNLPARILGARPTAELPKSMMIGDLKLTTLKSRLSSVGVQAELVGEGVLICGAMENPGRRLGAGANVTQGDLGKNVAVRKTARGKVEIEGNASDVYYIVRREVYNMFAVVAA